MTQENDIGDLTVSQAAPILEAEFRRRFGNEFDRLYRTLDLQLSEFVLGQEEQLSRIIFMLGRAGQDQTIIFLIVVWSAKKQASDILAQQRLDITRAKTVKQLLTEANKAVQ